ncbi:ShlB/FhaC/HecB family hemolysin secretion/activation protein [Exilibacterium tricleocarpae]|nr:ShlB/FhaC/HecB family hemolysin secretion/activation protein [Exilibacterium tricleocarpae]
MNVLPRHRRVCVVDLVKRSVWLLLWCKLGVGAVPGVYAQSDDTPEVSPRDLQIEYRDRTSNSLEPSPNFDLPPVRDRDEEVRIWVNKIEFVDLPEFPEQNIFAEDVLALAEQYRRRQMKEDQLLAGGFTEQELAELAGLLTEMGADMSARSMPQQVTRQQTADLVGLLQQQRAKRGMSLADLNRLAAEITQYYRRNGLFLARAIIPAQDVDAGIIKFQVLAGVNSAVKVNGAKKYTEEKIREPFARQIGGLVNNRDVEEGLYLLNDYPGLSVYGSFSAGEGVGETVLNIDVRREQAWQLSLRADNHGSQFTGDDRVYAVADLYNPLGFGDALSVGFLKSFSPEESDLAQISYDFPIFDSRTRMRLWADRNEFSVVDPKDNLLRILNLEGTNTTFGVGVNRHLLRSRARNLNLGFGLTQKDSSLESAIEQFDQDEEVRGLEFSAAGDLLQEASRILNAGNLLLQYGEFTSDVEEGRDEEFYKLSLNTTSLFFLPVPFTEVSTRLILKSRLQYSESALPAFEQLVLGGPQGVRAFTVRDFSADSAAYLGAEWYWDLPDFIDPEFANGLRLNDVMQVALFADGAYGSQNAIAQGESDVWGRVGGWGVLFKFSWMDRLSSQLSFARPSFARVSNDRLDQADESVQVFADFTWFFD